MRLTKKTLLTLSIITTLLTSSSLISVVVWADTGEIGSTEEHMTVNFQEKSNEFSHQALIPIAIVIALCLYSGVIKSTTSKSELFPP